LWVIFYLSEGGIMVKKMVLILLVVGFSVSLSYGHPAEIWQTGQKTTYATGDDGDLEKGVFWPVPRFTDHGNGTITDNLTGLMWTKNANLAGGAKFWQEALDYVKSINSGAGLGGYHDWRLPNRKELFSLIDHSKWDPALPASDPFQNVQSDCYWSSTTPGRPEESHLQSPTDPYMSLSTHTARASLSLEAS